MQWNILSFGRLRCNVYVQEARQEQHVVRYQAAVLRAAEEVDNALVSYDRERQRRVHLAEQVARSTGPQPRLYQWCGTDDFLYADNLIFRDRARALGLDLTYEEGPGGHEWLCWDRQIQRVLEWLPLRRQMV